jgi:ribonuclease P protein component
MAAVWRVRDRATFAALRREGRRRRATALTVTSLPAADPAARPAVAFAIGRSVGGAVERNRLRRRIRALLPELDLAPGTYLISAGPAATRLDQAELRSQLLEATS